MGLPKFTPYEYLIIPDTVDNKLRSVAVMEQLINDACKDGWVLWGYFYSSSGVRDYPRREAVMYRRRDE